MLLGFADSATAQERRREREDKKEDGEQGQELNEKVAGVVAPRRGRRRPIFPKGSLLKKPQQPRLVCLFFPEHTASFKGPVGRQENVSNLCKSNNFFNLSEMRERRSHTVRWTLLKV